MSRHFKNDGPLDNGANGGSGMNDANMKCSDSLKIQSDEPISEVPDWREQSEPIRPAPSIRRMRSMRHGMAWFAVLAALLLLATLFSPLVHAAPETSVSPGAPPAIGGSSTSATGDFWKPNDDDGSGYVRPHETTSSFSTSPVTSQVKTSAGFVLSSEDDDSYSFSTKFGLYSFSKNNPSVLVLSIDGEDAAFARFGAASDLTIVAGGATVLSKGPNSLTSLQPLLCNGSKFASLLTSTQFFEDNRPKITAWLEFSSLMANHWISLEWIVELTHEYYRLPGVETPLSARNLSGAKLPGLDAFSAGTLPREVTNLESVSLGPSRIESICAVDWSDAVQGNASLTCAAGQEHACLCVSFPRNVTRIDPTIAGTTTSEYALSMGPFRNLVSYDGVYWLFYYDGAHLVYVRSDNDGGNWTNPIAIPSSDNGGLSGYAFDVAVQGNHIALTWLTHKLPAPSTKYNMSFMEGYINGASISWAPRILAAEIYLDTPGWMGGCTLAPDGSAYLSYSDRRSSGGAGQEVKVFTLKKSRYQSSFSEFENQFGPFDITTQSKKVASRIMYQPSGGVLLLAVINVLVGSQWETLARWDIYHSTGWEANPNAPWCVSLVDVISEYRAFSACTGKSNETLMAFRTSEGRLSCLSLKQDGYPHITATGFQDSSGIPTISSDPAADGHVYFASGEELYETHTGPGAATWSTPALSCLYEPWMRVLSPSAPEKLQSMESLTFMDANCSPMKIMFGCLPLPADSTTAYADPWSGAGISQDQPFSTGVSDTISPGNGLLYLFQTDFVVPGRGMDLVASRFFATPQYFVQNSTGSYGPYLYDQFPYCEIGEGWQLNLPWIDTSYVHLWGGTKYAIEWDESGMNFNCTKGQQFTLTKDANGYKLDLQDGMRVVFDLSGKPSCILPNRLLGLPADIEFDYVADRLSMMYDYLGRSINFTYYAIGPDTGLLQTMEFCGNSVVFDYSGGRLVGTKDGLHRATNFSYSTSNPSLLVSSVTFPTGGGCSYEYTSIEVGSEAIAMLVSTKDERPHTSTDEGHRIIYSYTVLDGAIRYCQMDDYSWMTHPSYWGSTEYNFDSDAKNSQTTSLQWNSDLRRLEPLKRTISWYSMDGKISRVESLNDMQGQPDESSIMRDNKGNGVYSKDASGHEVFSSYSNTSTGNAFLRPASLGLNSSGKLFYDDFSDWVPDGWSTFSGWGSASVGSYLGDTALDPNLKLIAYSPPFASGIRLAGAGVTDLILDFKVRVPSTQVNTTFALSSSTGDVVTGVRFSQETGGPSIQITNGQDWFRLVGFSANVTYRITLDVRNSGDHYTTTPYLDGFYLDSWSSLVSPAGNPIRYFRVVTGTAGSTNSTVIDSVKVFKNVNVHIDGLQSGMFVELYDNSNKLLRRAKASGPTLNLPMNFTDVFGNAGCLVIKNRTGVTELIDSYRQIWGGDEYHFVGGSYLKAATSKTSMGFDKVNVFLDDQLPPNSISDNFNWVSSTLALSGAKVHHDVASTGKQQHSLRPAVLGQHMGWIQSRFIQYVYLPPEDCPVEIALRLCEVFKNHGVWTYQWSRMVYWGPDAILDETSDRLYAGPLPAPGQWAMLSVPWSFFNVQDWFDGIKFLHFGGDPYWDRSCSWTPIDDEYGKLKITGLGSGADAYLKKLDGTTIAWAHEQNGIASLNLHAAGVTISPLAGSIHVYSSNGSLEYASPLYTGIFHGDVFSYNRAICPFLSGPLAPAGFAKLPLGTMQYVDLAHTKLMESYMKYDSQRPFLLYQEKTMNVTGPLFTTYYYDGYGNVRQTRDPTGAMLNYSYVSLGTYLKSTWILNGTGQNRQNISTSYDYYPNGLLKNETDGLSRTTTYEHDVAGRVTKVTKPRIQGVLVSERNVYDDVNLTVTYFDENGTRRVTSYDEYGRPLAEERYLKDDSFYSIRLYTYDWNGRVSTVSDGYRSLYTSYDYLGRPLQVYNSDGTFKRVVYDDKNYTTVSYDELGNRKDLVYDTVGRVIQTVSHLGATKVYENITYDEIGDVTSVESAWGTSTSQYDCLGRLVSCHTPGGGYVNYTYDGAGRILTTRRGPIETMMTYKYDVAGRLVRHQSLPDPVLPKTSVSYAYNNASEVVKIEKSDRDKTPNLFTTVTRTYDAWGRVQNETTAFDGSTYTIRYCYDNRSNLISVDSNDGTYRIAYAYDDLNRVTSIRDATSSIFVVANMAYNEADQLASMSHGSGDTTIFTINQARGWVDRVLTKDLSQNTLLDETYGYDSRARITGVNGLRSYAYDELGRLSYANDSSAWGTLHYTYDLKGNRLSQTIGSSTTTYGYQSNGAISWANSGSTNTSYGYDGSGRQISKGRGTYLFFDYDTGSDRLSTVHTTPGGGTYLEKYWYDSIGRVIKSEQDGVTEYTLYGGSTPILNTTGSITTLHFYAGGLHVAKKIGSQYYYYHEDAQGNVRVVMEGTALSFMTKYTPFGEPWLPTGTEEHRFLDSKTTKTTGLIQFGARYYDPTLGRFITDDPVLGSLLDPQSLNQWAYCMNDPVNRVDLNGAFSFKKIGHFFSGVIDGAANLVGEGIELATDAVAAAVEAGVDAVRAALDTAQKVVDAVNDAVTAVVETCANALAAVEEAWDHLDSGLKQWIINGISMAVSFIPIAGPLISCIIDGTFVDMWNAIQSGDWATLALGCVAFIPGAGKMAKLGTKGLEKVGLKTVNSFGKSAEKKALKGLVLEKAGRSYRFSGGAKGSLNHMVEQNHLGQIAGKLHTKNLDDTMDAIRQEWRNVGDKLPATNPDYVRYNSPRGLAFILHEDTGTIVTIHPFG